MLLTSSDIATLRQHAISAALRAGEVLNSYSLKNLTINKKKQASSLAGAVVTEADLKSQEIIAEALFPTCKKYDLAFLGEEKPDDKQRFIKDYFWCVDPLDGTLPFTEGKNGYAVSIALVSKKGESVLGVVHNPPTNRTWVADQHDGVFLNGSPLSLTNDPSSQEALFFVDRSFLSDPRFETTKNILQELSSNAGFDKISIQHFGGAVMQAIAVLEAPRACYFKLSRAGNTGGSLWDYAATNCIFNTAGAYVSNIFGNPMDLNRKESTFMNHRGLIYATDHKMAEIIFEYVNLLG